MTGQNHQWRGAVLATVTGATWPRTRLARAGIQLGTDQCQRCLEEPDSAWHRAYGCKRKSGHAQQAESAVMGHEGAACALHTFLSRATCERRPRAVCSSFAA